MSLFFVLWWLKVSTVEHQTEALGLEHQDNYSCAERGGNHNFIVVANALLFGAPWFSACMAALLLLGRVLCAAPSAPSREPHAQSSPSTTQCEDTLLLKFSIEELMRPFVLHFHMVSLKSMFYLDRPASKGQHNWCAYVCKKDKDMKMNALY